MTYRFEQFLNARSAYGATVDAAGDRIYFISDLTGSPQLWSLPTGDGEAWPEPVAVNLDRVMFATPSSKPGRLVFGADVGGNERLQLYLVDGSGRAPRALTDSPTTIHSFGGWHPDGQQIAFSRDNRSIPNLYVMNADGSGQRRVTREPIHVWGASWSPDGRRLTFASSDKLS